MDEVDDRAEEPGGGLAIGDHDESQDDGDENGGDNGPDPGHGGRAAFFARLGGAVAGVVGVADRAEDTVVAWKVCHVVGGGARRVGGGCRHQHGC